MTNGAVMTNAQGFFGSNLKYCGYDALVLQGQANRWVYVYINDDVVELRDASHLLGKDTWEMQDDLQAEHGLSGHQMSVYGVGPAGEKIVRYAIIEGDLRPRRQQERLRRGNGQEEREVRGHSPRDEGRSRPRHRWLVPGCGHNRPRP